MLTSLELTDYRVYRTCSIEFHPGMNVITGTSDAGKSAIIGAILLGITNKPMGDSYRSWAASKDGTVEVAMEFDNGWFIRKRQGTKNFYECEEGRFEALRTDIPEVIQHIANITEYNVQTQFQKYFMLQDSAGDRAKRLNELVGLDIIDRLFKKLNSKITLIRGKITSLNADINAITEELQNLDYLDAVALQIEKLDDDINRYTENCVKKDLLASLINKLHSIDDEVAQHREVLKQEEVYRKLNLKILTYDELLFQYNHLKESIASLKQVNSDLQADKDWLVVEEPYITLKVLSLRYEVNTETNKSLDQFVKALKHMESRISEETLKQTKATKKYVELLETNKVCPTCGVDINLEIISRIQKSML